MASASAAAISRLSFPPVRLSSTGWTASRSGVTASTSAAASRWAPSLPPAPGSLSGGWRACLNTPPVARPDAPGASACTPANGVTAPSGYPGPSSPAYSSGSGLPIRPVTAAAQLARSDRTTARPVRAR